MGVGGSLEAAVVRHVAGAAESLVKRKGGEGEEDEPPSLDVSDIEDEIVLGEPIIGKDMGGGLRRRNGIGREGEVSKNGIPTNFQEESAFGTEGQGRPSFSSFEGDEDEVGSMSFERESSIGRINEESRVPLWSGGGLSLPDSLELEDAFLDSKESNWSKERMGKSDGDGTEWSLGEKDDH